MGRNMALVIWLISTSHYLIITLLIVVEELLYSKIQSVGESQVRLLAIL